MSKTDKFLVYTNPLTWVYLIVFFLFKLSVFVFNYIGVNDWYFVLLEHSIASKEDNEKFVENYKRNKHLANHSYTKRKAWEYLYNKLTK